jgi:hypothetical protein
MLLASEPQQERWDLLAGVVLATDWAREKKAFLEACMRRIERLWVYSASLWKSTARSVIRGSRGRGEIVEELFPTTPPEKNGRCSRGDGRLNTERGMQG